MINLEKLKCHKCNNRDKLNLEEKRCNETGKLVEVHLICSNCNIQLKKYQLNEKRE